MTNYSDIPIVPFVYQEIKQHSFSKDQPNDLDEILSKCIIELIRQGGFTHYDSECLSLLRKCLSDFSQDIIRRFKQHSEIVDSSQTFQDILERTLDEVMSINLHDLYKFIK